MAAGMPWRSGVRSPGCQRVESQTLAPWRRPRDPTGQQKRPGWEGRAEGKRVPDPRLDNAAGSTSSQVSAAGIAGALPQHAARGYHAGGCSLCHGRRHRSPWRMHCIHGYIRSCGRGWMLLRTLTPRWGREPREPDRGGNAAPT